MAKLPPIVQSRLASTTNELERDEDEFEDSLNVSISEQISEEIDETNSAEDSIDKSKPQIDVEKRKKLFNLDSDEGNEDDDDVAVETANRSSTYSKFDENLDALLSGENIAQHFRVVDDEKSDEKRSEDVDIGADGRTVDEDVNVDSEAMEKQSENISETKIVKRNDDNDGDDDAEQSVGASEINAKISASNERSRNSLSVDGNGGREENDVILINDHEISIHSLKRQQTQRSTEPSVTNQNTISDVSELLPEEKTQKSSENRSEQNSRRCSVERDASENLLSQQKSESKIGESDKSESLTEKIDEKSDEKVDEMKEIIGEAINKLPLDRPEIILHSQRLNSATTTAASERQSSSDVTEINRAIIGLPIDRQLQDELDINLLHLQNRIVELRNITTGKYTLTSSLNLQLDSPSRRDSLKDGRDSVRDYPQSGRDSTSITTNSTEYKTFQEEYLRVSFFHVFVTPFELFHLNFSLVFS